MKKIRKMYSGVVPNGKVLNSRNDSLQDTYSSDYLNRAIPDTNDLGEIVVDKIKCKNLFDVTNVTSSARCTYSIDKKNGILTVNANGTNANVSFNVGILPAGTYTISCKANSDGYKGLLINLDKTYHTSTSASDMKLTFTLSKDTHVNFAFYASSASSSSTNTTTFTDIQLEKGSVVTDYVEYQEIGNKQVYSENEQVVGEWLGKPLYRKVFNIGLLPNATNLTIAHNLPSIDMIRTNGSFGIANGYSVPIPNASAGSSINGQIAINVDRSNIYLTTNSNRSDLTGYIILEYTKTTD